MIKDCVHTCLVHGCSNWLKIYDVLIVEGNDKREIHDMCYAFSLLNHFNVEDRVTDTGSGQTQGLSNLIESWEKWNLERGLRKADFGYWVCICTKTSSKFVVNCCFIRCK